MIIYGFEAFDHFADYKYAIRYQGHVFVHEKCTR